MAPVLPFTSDEVWALIPGRPAESVHLAIFPEPKEPGPLGDWPALLEVRSVVTKALEEERAAKRIAGSLEARVDRARAAGRPGHAARATRSGARCSPATWPTCSS